MPGLAKLWALATSREMKLATKNSDIIRIGKKTAVKKRKSTETRIAWLFTLSFDDDEEEEKEGEGEEEDRGEMKISNKRNRWKKKTRTMTK